MSKIIATGAYLPERRLTNDDLIEAYDLESSDEWISQRTGIKARHFAQEDERVADLATKAAEDLLAKLDDLQEVVQKIKHVIVATMSAYSPSPSVGAEVQARINATNAWGMDVNGACSGFVMALELAEKLSKDSTDGYTLVIGAEKMTNILDLYDKRTSILFGDGAGALLIEHDGQGLPDYRSDIHTAEDRTQAISYKVSPESDQYLQMVGRDVFKFVSQVVVRELESFIEQGDQSIDYLICHQANKRLLDIFSRKLGISDEMIPSNIEHVANLSAGSIPVLIDALVKNDTLSLDQSIRVVICGFGGGLSWGQIQMMI